MSTATLVSPIPLGLQLNINVSGSTFSLTSFPFDIMIDAEQMTVTGLSYPPDPTFWDIIQAVNGTTAATHAFGATITSVAGGGSGGGGGAALLLESGQSLLLESGQNLLLEGSAAVVVVPPVDTGGPPIGTVGGGGLGKFAPPSTDQSSRLLAGRVHISRRLEIYEADQKTLWMTSDACPIETQAGGSVSVDVSRDERRDIDISFVPLDKRLRIGRGQLWYDKIIRPYYGFYYGDDLLYEVALGDFMPDRIEDSHIPSTIHVTGRDLTKRLITSQFSNSLTIANGTEVGVIITALCANAGLPAVSLPWAAGTGPRLTFDLTLQADSTRLAACQTVLSALGYEIFMLADGTPIVRPFQDPATFAPVWTFKTGEPDGNLVGGSTPPVRSTNDSNLFNHVVVRGSQSNNSLVFAEAIVTDTSSPVHADAIGDRTWPFLSSLVASNTEAFLLAQSYLKVMALESYEVDLTSIVIPWLDGGDVVGYVDPDPELDQPGNYLLSSFTIPFGLDPMAGVVKRVVSVL